MNERFAELASKAEIALGGMTLAEWEIDLAPLAALEVLSEAQFRIVAGQAEIFYDGEWLQFGRTDLTDDVGTSRAFDDTDALNGRVTGYLERGVFGARIRSRAKRRFFEVIDTYSDG